MSDAEWWHLFWHNFRLQAAALAPIVALIAAMLGFLVWSRK